MPNSWGALLALACFASIAGFIGIGLLQYYLDTPRVYAGAIESTIPDGNRAGVEKSSAKRQLATATPAAPPPNDPRQDLTARTTQIADRIEDVLRVSGSVHVRTATTELRESDTALWRYAVVQAQFRSASMAKNLTPRLAMAFSDNTVRIEKIKGAPDGQQWLSVRCQGIECVAVHAVTGVLETPEFELASLAAEWSGLNPDELMREYSPDTEALPLDSTDIKLDAPAPGSTPVQSHAGPLQLAIIVDDGGYGGRITEDILAMPNALTLSILPHAPYSYETAQRATQLGFEVMLHMPMENVSGKTTFPGEITVDMDANEMLDLTNQALADVPGAVGINNHTGSKFTSDTGAMRTWFGLIKDRGYFFVDSRTAHTARAFEIADEMEVPSAENELFLDHQPAPDRIRARIAQVIEMVKRNGHAICICHFRKNTVPILRAAIPEIEKEGIQIVHASTLVH